MVHGADVQDGPRQQLVFSGKTAIHIVKLVEMQLVVIVMSLVKPRATDVRLTRINANVEELGGVLINPLAWHLDSENNMKTIL